MGATSPKRKDKIETLKRENLSGRAKNAAPILKSKKNRKKVNDHHRPWKITEPYEIARKEEPRAVVGKVRKTRPEGTEEKTEIFNLKGEFREGGKLRHKTGGEASQDCLSMPKGGEKNSKKANDHRLKGEAAQTNRKRHRPLRRSSKTPTPLERKRTPSPLSGGGGGGPILRTSP